MSINRYRGWVSRSTSAYLRSRLVRGESAKNPGYQESISDVGKREKGKCHPYVLRVSCPRDAQVIPIPHQPPRSIRTLGFPDKEWPRGYREQTTNSVSGATKPPRPMKSSMSKRLTIHFAPKTLEGETCPLYLQRQSGRETERKAQSYVCPP